MLDEQRQVRPHPLNGEFAWVRCTAPLRRLSAAQRDQFDTLGFIKVEQAFTPGEIAAVTAAIDPLEAKAEQRLREAGGTISISTADTITFTTHVVKRSPLLRQFAAHPFVVDVCHDLMGGRCASTGTSRSTKRPRKCRNFRGTRITATPSSSRSST
jgi:hypothetical protein